MDTLCIPLRLMHVAIFISIALSEFKTLDIKITPYSVNAKGRYFKSPQLEAPNWDLKV